MESINLDINKGKPGTYHIVHGHPAVARDNIKLESVTFPGLVRFCTVRRDAILERKAETHLRVCHSEQTFTLDIEECGGHNAVGQEYTPAIELTARAAETEDHKAVKRMMSTQWGAHELGKHIQTLRHLFGDDKDGWSALVIKLRTMRNQIKSIYENSSTDAGQRKQVAEQALESAEAIEFTLRYKLYENTPEQSVTLFVAYDVTGNGVVLRLLGTELVKQERDTVDKLIADAREKIFALFGEEIPIVDVN